MSPPSSLAFISAALQAICFPSVDSRNLSRLSNGASVYRDTDTQNYARQIHSGLRSISTSHEMTRAPNRLPLFALSHPLA